MKTTRHNFLSASFLGLALGVAALSTAAPASATMIGGPRVEHYDTVKPLTTDVYHLTFRGGELARVGVVGDGKTDIDLYIYDENNNLIASDDDNTSTCIAEWTPRWTGSFTVKIRNRGRLSSSYALLTN